MATLLMAALLMATLLMARLLMATIPNTYCERRAHDDSPCA